MPMEYSIICACGQPVQVIAAEAGTTKSCECGRPNRVPRLSELRRSLAAPATADWDSNRRQLEKLGIPEDILLRYGAANALRHLHQQGMLPLETFCLQCMSPTSESLNCWVECSVPQAKKEGWLTTIACLLSIDVLMHLAVESKTPVVHGEELVINAPLRLCADCASRLRKDRAAIRNLIRQLPLYQPLLKQYPEAAINC